MSGMVLDLLTEISSPGCDVVNILRRAHIIAVKLGLKKFDQWISYELNGYPNQEICPDYRKIKGVLKAFNPYHGWIPAIIDNAKTEESVCCQKILNSISEIVSLSKTETGYLIIEFSGERQARFNEVFNTPSPMNFTLHIPQTKVRDIVEKVKNTVLEWTLKLEEKGILGQDLKFSDIEKKSAKEIPQNVNNYYGPTNVINAPSEGMQIVSGNESVSFSSNNSSNKMSLVLTEIENAINKDKLDPEDRKKALELLSDIRDIIKGGKKPSVIKTLLIGLKDILIGAGGELTANLIQSKIQGLF